MNPLKPFSKNGVTAHRGNAACWPENTLPAFISALECGADWLELDVHESRDGILVVCHDETTGRTGSADLRIAETTYAELRQVDMAHAFRRQHSPMPEPCPFQVMPRLEDVLLLVMSQSHARVSIQPKSACVPAIAQLVKTLHAEAWIGFNDGDVEKLSRARSYFPDVPIFYDTGPGLKDIRQAVTTARERNFQAIVMHRDTVTRDTVACLHDAGLEPGAWTVNDPADMRRFRILGVYRLYTDDPVAFLKVLAESQA